MKPVAMMAHRGLRGLRGYEAVRDEPSLVQRFPSVPELVGVYQNPEGVEPRYIVLSEAGLYMGPGGQALGAIPWRGIRRVSLPSSKDESPLEVVLSLLDGTRHHVAIEGRAGRFQDLWRLGHVISRVVALLGSDSGEGARCP